jgi:23S rRNA pseudoU1915 N3-methylase RlmH
MTLHEAIFKMLEKRGRSMTTHELAEALNRIGWYQKMDNSKITSFQIHGRAKKHAHLFNRNSSRWSFSSDRYAAFIVPLYLICKRSFIKKLLVLQVTRLV